MAHPGLHRGDGVGDRHLRVVVGVDAPGHAGCARVGLERPPGVGEDGHHLVGQRAAVGVAQDQRPGARLARGPQRVQRIGPVRLVAVEVVLRVVDHLPAALGQERHGLRHHVQVLRRRGAQHLGHVQQPALAEDRDHGGLGRRQLAQVRVVARAGWRDGGSTRTRPACRSARSWCGRPRRTRCPWDCCPASRPRCRACRTRRASGRCAACRPATA